MSTNSATIACLLSRGGVPGSFAGMGHVAWARAGEEAAFRVLFEAHASRIYSLTLRVARQTGAAEGLTRDIFLEAFSHLDTVADDDGFARELNRCAARKLLTRHIDSVQSHSGQRGTGNWHLNFGISKD